MHSPQEGEDMDSMDHLRERFEALEQQMNVMGAHTRTVEQRRLWWRIPWCVAAVIALGLALAHPAVVQAKTFQCSAGDVRCLIDAITTANANGTENTIRLRAGTYTLTAVDNGTFSNTNGLPVITSMLTITGQGAETTIIERDATASAFRLLQVATAGNLTLKGLTLRGGGEPGIDGSGINNAGTLLISHSTIANNRGDIGGGIHNAGTLLISHSTIARNSGDEGGGIHNEGSVNLTHSTLADNISGHGGGGLFNFGGTVFMTNTTITGNSADGGGGLENVSGFGKVAAFVSITNSTFAENTGTVSGGIYNVNVGAIVLLTNSTLARNETLGFFGHGGGLENRSGTVRMQNTILALNTNALPPPPARDEAADCAGVVTSRGHNLIGVRTGCTLTLQPSDLTGDPGLETFTDNGTPGQGHFPLLLTSQAIDAGNDAVCPRRDQLGQRRSNIPRVGKSRCDIGAIEFRPHDAVEEHHDKDLAAAAQASQ